MNENITIRKFLPQDRAEIRRISCETSFLEFPRQEILADDEIIADSLTAYFIDHEPESCFVAVLADARVVGYLTGSKNVGKMHKVEFRMLVKLIIKALKKGLFLKPASWRYFYYSLRSLFRGEFMMPDFSKSYPALLHINIDKPYRGLGAGEKLIDAYLNYLKTEGVTGVHFGTFSEQAKGFFLKMGFEIIFQSKRSYLKPYTGKDANFYIFGRKFIGPALIKDDKNAKITLKQRIITLLKLNSTPHEISLGVAIGVFIAVTPLYGFHTIMVIIAAFLVRKVNKIAILLGTNISTTPTLPFITWAGYSIGRFMLGGNYPPLHWPVFKHFHYKDFLHLYFPLFIGSIVLGLGLAVLFYFLTLLFITKRNARKKSAAVLVLACFLLFCCGFDANQYTGEKVVYAISPVGMAEYNDLGVVEFEGKKVGLVTFHTRATGFEDLEKIYSDLVTKRPIKVERNIAFPIGREYIVEDYVSQENTLIVTKFDGKKKVKEYIFKSDGPIYNGVILPFYLRTIPDLAVGSTFTFSFPQKFTVNLVSIDEVSVPAGKFTAYHFISVPKKFEIWISNDKLRLPLKIYGLAGLNYKLLMKEYHPGKAEPVVK